MINKDQVSLEQAYRRICESKMMSESSLKKEAYNFDAVIKKSPEKEHNRIIIMLLQKCITLYQIYQKTNCRFHETGDKFIFKMEVDLNLQAADIEMEDAEVLFLAYFEQEHEHYMKHSKEKNPKFKPYAFPKVEFKWNLAKYQEIIDRVPELEGVL